MAGVNWLGTALLTSAYGKFGGANADFSKTFLTQFANFNQNYLTWGGTSPFYTNGAGGWTEVRYLEKMAEWGGYANLAANADYAMKVSGYKSWSKFVKDGRTGDLFPSIENSLVRYAASTLHYSAINNMEMAMSGFEGIRSLKGEFGVRKIPFLMNSRIRFRIIPRYFLTRKRKTPQLV